MSISTPNKSACPQHPEAYTIKDNAGNPVCAKCEYEQMKADLIRKLRMPLS